MIYEGSRYEEAPVYRIRLPEGRRELALFALEYWPTEFDFVLYTVKVGDRFDLLAHRYFNDAELWWWIAAANPEIEYTDTLIEGTKIRIPYDV